ncbi:hypothetical protein F511_14617 [Dorcoceras hygrometricum]|uniref:Uncharacterized protein n=1 Tax=Dorcoceras hygrometricum TaxID=472368 RepID=A0A2Z7D0T4_9LAMI|nr:hypothetical protein F511_14617 [Dorcoceras hygrometricum]
MFRAFTFGDLVHGSDCSAKRDSPSTVEQLQSSNPVHDQNLKSFACFSLEKPAKVLRMESPREDGRNEFQQRHDDGVDDERRRRWRQGTMAGRRDKGESDGRGAIEYLSIQSDSVGYPCTRASDESLTMKHRLLYASGRHPIPPPNDPNGVSKRVKVFHVESQ